MMLPRRYRRRLRQGDRWRVEDMLAEQPDLQETNPGRDLNLWRHLFAPDDFVRVGTQCRAACEATAEEWCSGNIWRSDGVIVATVALCWPALALLRGATCKEPMSRSQACEAVLARLRAARMEVVMMVEDGEDGLECWIDPVPGSYPIPSRGRCPGGVNSRTGRLHRVVWAHPVTRIAWEDDDWPVGEAAHDGSQ